MSVQVGHAVAHTLATGDVPMRKQKRKAYNLRFVLVEDRSAEIAKRLAKSAIEKVLEKHGAVSYNLDEVLNKYVTGEMRYDQKTRGIRSGIDDERVAER